MGFVSRKAKIKGEYIKCFKGPAAIVARNGQAGKVMYIEKDVFTINDHAYVVTGILKIALHQKKPIGVLVKIITNSLFIYMGEDGKNVEYRIA